MKNGIVIMAGNPLIRRMDRGEIEFDSQILAFEEAMKLVVSTRDSIRKIYVIMDHIGIFQEQFLRPETSVRKKKKPTLENLVDEARDAYVSIAQAYEVSLSDIAIITEADSRMGMLQRQSKIPEECRPWIVKRGATSCENNTCMSDKEDREDEKLRVTCRGIIVESIRRMSQHGDIIEAFWEYRPLRCEPNTIADGAGLAKKLSKELGMREDMKIRQTMVIQHSDGGLRRKEIPSTHEKYL